MSVSAAPVCRLCLAVDTRLLTISGSLQQVYERISDNDLYTDDVRPVAACYVCYAQLQKCQRLMLTSARAENVLNAIVYSNSQITVQSVSKVDRCWASGLCGSLNFSKVEYFETIPPPVAAEPESDDDDLDDDDLDVEDNDCDIEADESDVEIVKVEDPSVDPVEISDTECEDLVDPISLVRPSDMAIDNFTDFPEPINIVVSGVKKEAGGPDVDHCATDNCPLESLRAETRVEGELRGDGASAHKSGSEKQERADGNVTTRNQQPRCHQCHVCQRSFVPKSSLTCHLKTHTGEKPYQCHICQHDFSTSLALTSHLKLHDVQNAKCKSDLKMNSEPAPYQKATSKSNLEVNSEQTLYQKATSKSNLKVTSEQTLYQKATSKSILKVNSEQTLCQRATSKSDLKVNSELTPYQRATSKSDLKVNSKPTTYQSEYKSDFRVYAGPTPFQCNICRLQFNCRYSLNVHLRLFCIRQPYPCDICRNIFKNKSTFRRHVLSTHF